MSGACDGEPAVFNSSCRRQHPQLPPDVKDPANASRQEKQGVKCAPLVAGQNVAAPEPKIL